MIVIYFSSSTSCFTLYSHVQVTKHICFIIRDPSNPFVEQAVQYAVAAAHVLCKGDSERDALCKLLLQGIEHSSCNLQVSFF